MNIGHIQGGTNAGWRNVRAQSTDWVCPTRNGGCGKALRYYWVKCPNCGHARPEREQ